MDSPYQPDHFINRELSWLEFNRRVLEEAEDVTQPLMERVKFLSIFSSNLDEFFEIRVAGIKQQFESGTALLGPERLSPAEIFHSIQKQVHQLVKKQYDLWNNDLVPLLKEHKICIHEMHSLSREDEEWAHQFFLNEVFPVLTPLAVDSSHPFPQILNKSHNLIVRAFKPNGSKNPLYAIVQVPRIVPRLVRLPSAKDRWDYVYLSSLMKYFMKELFPGLILDGIHAFRITRNSDLYIDEEEAENLLRAIEEELHRRNRGNVVRLEVEQDCPEYFQKLLLDTFKLSQADLYKLNGPLTMLHLTPLYTNESFAVLKDRPFHPGNPLTLNSRSNIFETMRKQDILLHHPYESFDHVVSLIEKASVDPQVLAIKITLYRTSGDSPIIEALKQAAYNGKQVTALVELKARFDEANNIQWGKQLEEAGAHVVYGVVGLKIHCKMCLIVRKDEDRIRHYVHLGTGNYHPRTAKIYTDLSLLTTRQEITSETATLFNVLTGLTEYPGFNKLWVAPFDLQKKLHTRIQRERDIALEGKPARIIIKMNSLVDEKMIAALYEASTAGVKIDLIVRGICCLRPKIPQVSENIRVVSIVGRFLEHSRIFYFSNNGSSEIYLGSADCMPRNFLRRIEVLFPVEDSSLKKEITDVILSAFLKDCVKARELQSDGTYLRLKPTSDKELFQAQRYFRERSREIRAKQMVESEQATPLAVIQSIAE